MHALTASSVLLIALRPCSVSARLVMVEVTMLRCLGSSGALPVQIRVECAVSVRAQAQGHGTYAALRIRSCVAVGLGAYTVLCIQYTKLQAPATRDPSNVAA